MKKSILFSVILALFCTFSFAQKGFEAKFSQPSNSEYQVAFLLTDWSIQHVQFDGEDFQQIVFNSTTVTQKQGWAELPFISAAVQLPAQKNVDVSVALTDYTDYQLDFPLVPSRGVIYRNQDPATIPYVIDPASIVNEFYPVDLATADEPYIIRDVRGTSIRVFPFQYNAATNTLRVYNKVDVLLTENNEPATNPLLTENPNPLREMRGIYPTLFLNYAQPRIPLVMAQHGEMLVITTPRDEETIDTYIKWKQEKGFVVHKEVVATGTNVKTLIQQKYNANNNILYVQLVGDWADIKSDLGGGAGAPTDPKMGCVVGTDNFPEIAVGRFSCTNATELTTQINKAIQYEKDPDMGTWYSSFIGMGSNATGPADDGEKDWLHVQRIYSQRLEPTYDYNTHYRLYENESGCTSANLTNYLNTGASTIAYCGHGSRTSFVTTGFSNSNINNLTNGTKLPFIVSVACVNGEFHTNGDCFAEAWLKKQNGGAVVTWMSTINQPWAEPMRGQDYFYDIIIGGFDYSYGQYGLPSNELRTTWGSIVVNAGNLMLTESQYSADVNTLHTWTTFGDASLQLRTKPPVELEVSELSIIAGMPFEITVTADGVPVQDALVCISQEDVYLAAFTDENGVVSIEHEFVSDEVLLVVSAFNTTTIYETMEFSSTLACVKPVDVQVVQDENNAIITWEDSEDMEGVLLGYNVYRDNEQINEELVTEKQYIDENLEVGEYTYQVNAVYKHCTTELTDEVPMTIVPCEMPKNLEVKQESNFLLISWDQPENAKSILGYNIFRDGEKLNTDVISEREYEDTDVVPETEYCYAVSAVYTYDESEKTDPECFTLLGVNDYQEASFSLYPNPTTGVLNLIQETITNYELGPELNSGTNIEIFDVYGRKLSSNHLIGSSSHYLINISDFSAGVYFVKISTETGEIAVKRVILIK